MISIDKCIENAQLWADSLVAANSSFAYIGFDLVDALKTHKCENGG